MSRKILSLALAGVIAAGSALAAAPPPAQAIEGGTRLEALRQNNLPSDAERSRAINRDRGDRSERREARRDRGDYHRDRRHYRRDYAYRHYYRDYDRYRYRYPRRYRYYDNDFGSVAAGIAGALALGIIASSASVSHSRSDWERCDARYRSFRWSDGTFQPYNGPRKLCPYLY